MKAMNLLKKMTLVIALSMLMIPVLTAQNQKQRRTVDCQISNLTIEQNHQIDQLRAEHLKIMEGLRADRRATADAVAMTKVREKMKAELARHKGAVAKLLTPEQLAQYQQNNNMKRRCVVSKGNGNRKGNCYSNCRKGKRGNGNRGCARRGNANS